MASSMSLVLVAIGLMSTAEGNAFRGGSVTGNFGHMSKEEVKVTVLEDVISALGIGNRVTEDRLQEIERTLQPIFLAMPRNAYGNLDHASARYVMHRLFVQRHAMYIKGLEPGGGSWSDGNVSASDVLQDRVPEFVQSLFEDRLQGRGLGMHELAVLAATLEHLIHDEAVKRLEMSYAAHQLGTDARLSDFEANALLDTYMMIFIQGLNISDTVSPEVFVPKMAAYLKKQGTAPIPSWINLVKNSKHNELAPYDPDWYYIRMASTLRHLYVRAPAGVGALTKINGGRMRRGTAPSHSIKSNKSIARKVCQSLEELKLVEKDSSGGRRLTAAGRRDMDRLAREVYTSKKK